jgi:hypothetical protein
MPLLTFSKVIVQRGTIIMFAAAGAGAAVPMIPVVPGMLTPAIPIPPRSVFIAVVIHCSPYWKQKISGGRLLTYPGRIVTIRHHTFKT